MWREKETYRVTMVVRDYILLGLILKFHNLAHLIYNFCQFCSGQSRIGRTVEQPKCSQLILVADHHAHPVLIRKVRGPKELQGQHTIWTRVNKFRIGVQIVTGPWP